MSLGYTGKILRIDLTKNKIWVDEHDETYYRENIGGRNIIADYLIRLTEKNIDPLSEKNVLIFATGVLTGIPVGGSGRNSVGAKSPLSGFFGVSEAGGFWGAELKRAGYDALVIEGRSPCPVYIYINDEHVTICDARDIWGKKTAEALDILREKTGKRNLRTAMIGPGGENLVRFACIMNDINHAYGRTGMGAVMGSKNLKCVAVSGSGRVETADPEKISEIHKWLVENKDDYCDWLELGTMSGMVEQNELGGLPTKNFNLGIYDDAEKLSAEVMNETMTVATGTCFACPVRCKQKVKVEGAYSVDPVYGGPEYESAAAFGPMCLINDLEAVAKANELCNAYGLDTINTGSVIAFAMECFENGLIPEQPEGLRPEFGNAQALIELIEQITYGKGLGAILKEGHRSAALAIGGSAGDYAMEVKNVALPYHDPRVKQGMSIGYATIAFGADHCSNIFDEFFVPDGGMTENMTSCGVLEGLPMEELSPAKVRLYMRMSMFSTLFDCLTMCNSMPYTPEQITELVKAATGWNCTYLELYKASERSINIARLYNFREGMSLEDEDLPQRMFQVATGCEGSSVIDRGSFLKMRSLYYGMMGWKEDGMPTQSKLYDLGLDWTAEYLQ